MNSVLGVVGSPRKKGNTDILVSTILQGAKDQGAETYTLYLGDLTIRECNGCHVCWKGKPCSKSDDMNEIYPRISGSDAIVFGTPVYWYGPTALMKGFIDRFVYFNCEENRWLVRGKRATIAVPFEEQDLHAADLVVAFFERSLRYLEMRLAGKILVPGVSQRGDVLQHEACLEACYGLGVTLASPDPRHD